MTTIALQARAWSPSAEQGAGSELDFQELVRTYSRDLYRYAFWLAGDRPTAEDLVQETLLRAWRSRRGLKERGSVKPWLMTILRRENARRFERFRPPTSEFPLEQLQSKDRGYDTSTEAFVLRQALGKLPEEYREPLYLQVVEGYSQKEIAERLGISPAGAGTRLFRARRKLREMLEG